MLAPKDDQLCLLVGIFLFALLARRLDAVPPILDVLQIFVPSFKSLNACEPSLSLSGEQRFRHSCDAAGVRSLTWILTLKDSINVESKDLELEESDVLLCWMFLMMTAAPSKRIFDSSPERNVKNI